MSRLTWDGTAEPVLKKKRTYSPYKKGNGNGTEYAEVTKCRIVHPRNVVLLIP